MTSPLALRVALWCALAVGMVSAIAIRSRAKKRRRTGSYGGLEGMKHVDIGAIFGLDVGGTLSKLVYFEQTTRSRKVEKAVTKRRRFTFFDDPKKGSLKRSRSLENLNTPRHTKALDAFYEFMHSDASPVKAELRDENLTFFSRILGGELHFMRFETRFMDRVIDIVKSNRLHHSINTIGCTGGGAFKFAEMFDDRLGITLKKMDELECLMRGLEFVLQHVVGECYTYKPDPKAPTSQEEREGPSVTTGSATMSLGLSRGSRPPSLIVTRPHENSSSNVMSSSSSSSNGDLPMPCPSDAASSVSSPSFAVFPPASSGDSLGMSSSVDVGSSTGGLNHTSSQGEAGPSPRTGREDGGGGGSKRGAGQSLSGSGDKQEWKYKVQRSGEHVIYPYLVVNIGSGVSILKVESPGRYERVSGSSLGGGTYWGLCRLVTRCKTFDEVLDLAEMGDASLVDMTVGDIYGGGYDKFHLSPSVIASSFGKLVMKEEAADGIREEDMARSLLMMITSNIGQVAYLNATIHKATHIYFVGNFLRHNKISCRRLAYAIDYWSAGKMEALFLEHEGYFGALGAFLKSSYGDELSGATTPNAAKEPTTSSQAHGKASPGSRAALRKQHTYSGGSASHGHLTTEMHRARSYGPDAMQHGESWEHEDEVVEPAVNALRNASE